ncbi:unnamed protein product [Ilex paraguariensis]|uniref:SEC7 domain-containing protein n=1 Tax=Ilex paraguariensis TaxID=185542 RepID=A0ABC8UCQ0_9AQUA
MAERISNGLVSSEQGSISLEEYTPFWMVKCDNYSDPDHWVPYTAGLDKNLVGDLVGNHDNFCVQTAWRITKDTKDQHNVQVKKKMTEEDFIRNNRHINGGK